MFRPHLRRILRACSMSLFRAIRSASGRGRVRQQPKPKIKGKIDRLGCNFRFPSHRDQFALSVRAAHFLSFPLRSFPGERVTSWGKDFKTNHIFFEHRKHRSLRIFSISFTQSSNLWAHFVKFHRPLFFWRKKNSCAMPLSVLTFFLLAPNPLFF